MWILKRQKPLISGQKCCTIEKTFLLLSRPQNIALDCIYIRLHKYSVKIPIITIALELSLHYHGHPKCEISTPLISVSRICVVHIHQMLCKACITHWHTLITCAISPNLPFPCSTIILQVLLFQNTPCFLCVVLRIPISTINP
jgi:hypothetical protein